MIYRILKPIIRLSLRIYFRRIDVIGLKKVPKKGPIIFVCNHPNALLDPLLVATTLNQKIHFLAGAEWFGKGLKNRFFRNQLLMIPVHRPWLSKNKNVSNSDMFEECYKSLAQGKCIILFPEATSETVSRIRELKTGAIRIKAGFEKYMENGQTVPIVPIGLSYSNAHAFQSRVVLKINDAIEFTNEEENKDAKEVYRMHTDQMRSAMEKSIIHVNNEENEGLVSKISRLYMDQHQENRGISFRNGQNKFEFNQKIAKAVAHFENENFDSYNQMSDRIDDYFKHLKEAKVSDDFIGQTERSKTTVTTWMFLILGISIALPSLLLFAIPFFLTRAIFNKKFRPILKKGKEPGTLDYTFTGTLIFGIGTVIFILWTLLVSAGIAVFFGWWAALVSLVVMYPMMRFGMLYAKTLLRFGRFRKTNRAVDSNKAIIHNLEEERESIIAELEKYHVEYDSVIA